MTPSFVEKKIFFVCLFVVTFAYCLISRLNNFILFVYFCFDKTERLRWGSILAAFQLKRTLARVRSRRSKMAELSNELHKMTFGDDEEGDNNQNSEEEGEENRDELEK